MKLKAIFAGIGLFISVLFFALFRSYKKGKEVEVQKRNDTAIKEALEIKKDEIARSSDGVDAARERLRKHARD